jgi:trans-2-enoyl-CoA reductase
MKIIEISDRCGNFAENKDIAKEYRERIIRPAVKQKEEITIDFSSVDSATQSFIHALISDVVQENGENVLDYMSFKNCNATVKSIISTVISYSLD